MQHIIDELTIFYSFLCILLHSIVQALQRRTISGLRWQLNACYWTHINANWVDLQCLKLKQMGAWGGRRSITASLKRTQCFELLCKCRIIQLMFWYYEILIMLKWTIQFWQMIFATLCICILVIDLFLPKNCKKENKNLNHQQWASLVAFAGGTYCRHLSLNGCHRSAAITLTVMQKENILCLYDDGKF